MTKLSNTDLKSKILIDRSIPEINWLISETLCNNVLSISCIVRFLQVLKQTFLHKCFQTLNTWWHQCLDNNEQEKVRLSLNNFKNYKFQNYEKFHNFSIIVKIFIFFFVESCFKIYSKYYTHEDAHCNGETLKKYC